MKIKVLGTRGEVEESAPYHSKRSGVLIDNTLLLDVGDERFLHLRPRAILITHLHPDHAYFVRHKEKPSVALPIYAPESYDEVKITLTKKPFKIGSYTITPIPTIHSAKVKSNAYLIEHKGKRVLYTGDMIWLEKKYQAHLGTLDLVITEASFMRKGGMVRREKETGQIYGHTGVPNLVALFKQFTSEILFVHFGAWFYKDIKKARREFAALARQHKVKIIVGYDGLELEI
jgi:ribonuclease BN (tRNA processing enzyme)